MTPVEQRVVHCWQDELDDIFTRFGWASDEHIAYERARLLDDGPGGTCLLLDGHEGPHEFTPDDQIGIRFVGEPTDDA